VRSVIILAMMIAAAAAQTPPPSAPPTAPKGDAEAGKKLFASYGCYQCHGYAGQGAAATGPRLAPRPIAFAAFARYIRQPSGDMPPYTTKVVTEQDVADIYAFLLAAPPPPAIDDVPLLK
jgi:ubiquinol-cytochrome c reductase cytochrome c subunit